MIRDIVDYYDNGVIQLKCKRSDKYFHVGLFQRYFKDGRLAYRDYNVLGEIRGFRELWDNGHQKEYHLL